MLALMDGQASRDAALDGAGPGDVLIGLGDRWLAGAGQGGLDPSALPRPGSAVARETPSALIPDVDALLDDGEAAAVALAAAFRVDADTLGDDTVVDGLSWIMGA